MKKEEVAPGIIVYSDVIPDSSRLYLDLESSMLKLGFEWGAASVKGEREAKVNVETRDTSTFGIPYWCDASSIEESTERDMFIKSMSSLFFCNFDPVERDYMSHYGVTTVWHDTNAILKYGRGQKFTNHIDDHQDYHRRISTVYYMNDNYEGGEINFPRFNLVIKPKANQMVVFPSTYVYNHSVSPVVSGERYAVVGWMR